MKATRKSYISGKTRFEVGGQSVRYLASRDVLTKKSGACLGRMEVFVSEADRDHYRSNLKRFEKTGERVRVAREMTALHASIPFLSSTFGVGRQKAERS